MKKYLLFILLIFVLFGSHPKNNIYVNPNTSSHELSDPMLDRAYGYLFKGKAKTAVTNYGEFVDWDVHPNGLWGDYTYLPDVSFIAGVPGQSYSYRYDWFNSEDPAENGDLCPE